MKTNQRLQQIRRMIFNPRCAECLIHRGLHDGQGMCQDCEDRAIQIFWWGARLVQQYQENPGNATIKQKQEGIGNGQENDTTSSQEGPGEIIPVQVFRFQVPQNPAQEAATKSFPSY